VATAPKTKPVKVSPANTVVDFKEAAQQITDLIVPGETIRHFLEIDLSALDSLPSGSRDLIALSLRVGRAFDTLCCRVFEFVAQEHEIPPRAREAVATELALDFIERYGALAFFSTNLIRVLWTEQRLPVAHGAKRLQEVGKRLAIFAMAQKAGKPCKSIDIGFALFKPDFLEELQELSRELGDSTSDQSRGEQMLDLIGTGKYLEAFMKGIPSIAEDLVFPSKAGTVLDHSNPTHYQFLPCLEQAGLRRFRFHDLRHLSLIHI